MAEIPGPSNLGLRSRFEQLRLLHSRLMGIREAAITSETAVTQKVSQAKGRLALTEEVQATLDVLQQRAHERSVGVFERLLSAIVSDVIPGKGKVKLELYSERGLPGLDVKIDNHGVLESALEASGGAVTNVLSTGLRFAALTRTANRRFCVLDEADCWIKPELVSLFIRVIAQVAEKSKTQTVLISHHESSLFEGLVNIVRLVKDEAGLKAQAVKPQVSSWTDDSVPGIRSIRLVNFWTHTDTTVPLFPGVTALVGDNDLGKSGTTIGALRAVAYGESDDTCIRHGETEARIILTLEQGRRIEWTRKLKGSPRVMYALYQHDTLLHEGRPVTRGQVPDWVTEVLGISRVDDMDIQLVSQKEPVFLLNQGPSIRAKLLSVGRESGRLRDLVEAYGNLCRKDREQVREGEAEIIRLNYRIRESSQLEALPGSFATLATQLAEIEAAAGKSAQLSRLLSRVSVIGARLRTYELQFAALETVPAQPPDIAPTAGLKRIIDSLTKTQRLARLAPSFPAITVPQLGDLRRVCDIGARIAKLAARAKARGVQATTPGLPLMRDTTSIARTGARLAAQHQAAQQLNTLLTAVVAEQEAAHRDFEAITQSLGGVCPLCENQLTRISSDRPHTVRPS